MREGYAGVLVGLADLTRYQIELDVDLDAKTLVGTQQIDYTNAEDEPLTEIVLRLLPNTPGYGGSMTVDTLLLDNAPVAPQLSLGDSALTVPLPQPLAPGESVELALTYQATLPTDGSAGYAQYGYIDDVLALPNAYPLIPVYDDEGWNAELAPPYGDATFSDVALYEVQVTLPSDVVLATTGATTAQTDNGDGTTTYTSVSGPMRDFCLIGSARYKTVEADVDGVRITSYYYTGEDEGGQRALDDAIEALRIYERLIGVYPFGELDVMSTPTAAGGIEYPGLIVAAAGLYPRQGGFFEWVIAHEVAHQWWYAMVGNDQLDEPWLDEALTQYTSLLYVEERYGPQAAARTLAARFEAPYQRLLDAGQDMAVGLPVAAYSEELYGSVVYGKGPLFFHALREQIGDEAFFELLRAYYDRYSYGVAYPQDFLTIAREIGGQETDALYKEWIWDTTEVK
jgi:aminopeptidase N